MKISLSSLVEKAVAAIVVPICIIIAVLDLFGLLDANSPFTNVVGNLPSISLILLSGLTAYLVFTYPENDKNRHNELIGRTERIEESIKTINLLSGRVQGFDDLSACVKYAKTHMLFAKNSVLCAYSDISLNLQKSVQPNVLCREVLFVDTAGNPALQNHFQLRKDQNPQNYTCAAFEPKDGVYNQFIVIDSTEVIFLSTISSNNLAVAHPQIASMFRFYFDEIERKATKLK